MARQGLTPLTLAGLLGAAFLGRARAAAAEARVAKDIESAIRGEPDMALDGSARRTVCRSSESEPCSMDTLDARKPSLVFPGGKTSCLENGNDYAFRVYPGDSDKLYLHFQGGGACWDEMTTLAQRSCKDGLAEHPTTGVFDKNREENPFRAYTIVMVVYCSGDVHVGDASQPYGNHISQVGYWNAKSAIDWARANVDERLASFVVGGCSAGSLGAQVWARSLLNDFSYDRASVLMDSYMPLFPVHSDSKLLHKLGACGTPLVDSDDQAACTSETLTFTDLLEKTIRTHPRVTFATLNSKADQTQQKFGTILGATMQIQPEIVSGESYFHAANVLLERLNKHPNFVTFLVGGDMQGQHCFLPLDEFYSTSVNGTATLQGRLPLTQWTERLAAGRIVKSDCWGEQLTPDEWAERAQQGVSYCDESLFPKYASSSSGKVLAARLNRLRASFDRKFETRTSAEAAGASPLRVAAGGFSLLAFAAAAMLMACRRLQEHPRSFSEVPLALDPSCME